MAGGPNRFSAATLKGLERRLDGLFEPEGHSGPVYVVEFQGQRAERALYNLLTKIGLYGEEHPQRDIIGVASFCARRTSPPFPDGRMTPRRPCLMSSCAGSCPTAYQSIFAEGVAKGMDEGLSEGEAQGLAKGKADSLKHLLRRRFDTFPVWAVQRIDAASIAQLDAWLDGIFDAQSLEALVGTERN